jgi:hypothetical protein
MSNFDFPVVHIGASQVAPSPSPGKPQAALAKLIRTIHQQRLLLQTWRETEQQYQRRQMSHVLPLVHAFSARQIDLLFALDRAAAGGGLGKVQIAKVKDIICTLAEGLLEQGDNPDLKRLFNAYSAIDFDTLQLERTELLKSALEGLFQVDLDEMPGAQTPEDLRRAVQEKLREQQAWEEEAQEQAVPAKRDRNRASSHASAQGVAIQAKEKHAGTVLRAIYRKLVSLLHPDRELDAAERARKTAWLQRANRAYREQDVLQLVELQTELGYANSLASAVLDAGLAGAFKTLLTQQSKALKTSISRVEQSFSPQHNAAVDGPLTPKAALKAQDAFIRDLKLQMTALERDLRSFADIKAVKFWLKTYRL